MAVYISADNAIVGCAPSVVLACGPKAYCGGRRLQKWLGVQMLVRLGSFLRKSHTPSSWAFASLRGWTGSGLPATIPGPHTSAMNRAQPTVWQPKRARVSLDFLAFGLRSISGWTSWRRAVRGVL